MALAPTHNFPDGVFIFVDRLNPVTMHNLRKTGRFTSANVEMLRDNQSPLPADTDAMPFVPNPHFHGRLSPYAANAINNYRIEWDAEIARQRHAPNAPSRMSAIFAFADKQTCCKVAEKHKWNIETVHRFRPVAGKPLRAHRVNMGVVSLARLAYRLASWSQDDLDRIWSHYWQGGEELTLEIPDLDHGMSQKSCHAEVIWEWLIEGTLEVVDVASDFH